VKKRDRILFIDDNADTRYLVEMWLSTSGYEVVTADGLASGLRIARADVFDLYLLDSRFADGSGKELCEKLREFDRRTPVIFYSGESPARQSLDMACGAQGFVVKPGLDALPQIISDAIHEAQVSSQAS
jgi:two-component system, OmpR family, copper resistance phosphate regulon response regulator CusR